jgi:hypothetical protein
MYIYILVAWLAMQMPDPKQKLDIEHFPIVVTKSCTYTFDSPFLSPSKSKYPPQRKIFLLNSPAVQKSMVSAAHGILPISG